jgi:hypothetical protein
VASTVLIVAALALGMPAIERQMDRWQLLPGAQHLTELYLEDAEAIPHAYQPGQQVAAGFAITNRTGSFRTYHYTITEISSDGSQRAELASGSIDVNTGDTGTVLKNVTPADFGKRVNIRISLTAEKLYTNFWLERQ